MNPFQKWLESMNRALLTGVSFSVHGHRQYRPVSQAGCDRFFEDLQHSRTLTLAMLRGRMPLGKLEESLGEAIESES
jgi:hypothetical protein